MKRYVHDKSAVEMIHDYKENEKASADLDEYGSTDDFWEEEDSKLVEDSDGFLTDYTLWHNVVTDEWCTIFGDKDLYTPMNDTPDMEFESEDDARDWFAEYNTDYDDEDY